MANKYVFVSNNIVQYSFDAFEEFRQKPAAELYAPEFLDSCILVDVTVVTDPGYIYDAETETFSPPPEPEPIPNGDEKTT